MTNPIPKGFTTLTPHITVKDPLRALEFYAKAFGAEETRRFMMGDSVGHAEMRIGNARLMLNGEYAEQGVLAPPEQGSGVRLHLYVEDVDASYERAVEAGATPVMPPADMFWGDRYSMLKDPFGHGWAIATQKEELTDEECSARAAAQFGGAGG